MRLELVRAAAFREDLNYTSARVVLRQLVHLSGGGQDVFEAWKKEYNEDRPHTAIQNRTLREFVD
jgi:hypothetical protein